MSFNPNSTRTGADIDRMISERALFAALARNTKPRGAGQMRDLKSKKWHVLTCREGYSVEERSTGERTYLNTGAQALQDWKNLAACKRESVAKFNYHCLCELERCKARGATFMTR